MTRVAFPDRDENLGEIERICPLKGLVLTQ